MPFDYTRPVRLADTDAAGVVYFARTLSLCHEAYEAALAAAGVSLARLLGGEVVVPISRCEADYLRPLRVGDELRVRVTPERLSANSFALRYDVIRLGSPEKLAARVRTEHVCTSPAQRARADLPPDLGAWVDAG